MIALIARLQIWLQDGKNMRHNFKKGLVTWVPNTVISWRKIQIYTEILDITMLKAIIEFCQKKLEIIQSRMCNVSKAKYLWRHICLRAYKGVPVVVQGSANPQTPGLVNFVTAVAYHLCLNLPRAFSQPGARGLADLCISVGTRCISGMFLFAHVSLVF